MSKNCAMLKADASQRGHTCWIDSVVVSVANSITAKEISLGKRSFSLKRDSSIKSDIFEHAGQEKYEEALHLSLNQMMGKDVCPLKPKEGHNALNFLKKLLDFLNIPKVILTTHAKSNTTIPPVDLQNCLMNTFDIYTYISDNIQKISITQIESGICAIQVVPSATGCSKITGLSEVIRVGNYELKLRNMLVSSHGHVITIGTCDNPTEWYVYDNEFTGKGSKLRKFESFTFQSTMDLMFNFPHTYFNPKIGAIPLNPLFLEGKQAATTFMFDISEIWSDN